MNQQQRAFAEAYAKSGNATSSAESAGYSAKTAPQMGYKLLKNRLVAAEIARLRAKLEKKAEISVERVMNELGKIAFGNLQQCFDPETGEMLPIHKMEPEVAATLTTYEKDGTLQKIKTAAKLPALETLSKILGMLKQEQSQGNNITITLAPHPEMPAPVDNAKLKPEW
jgi:phage terminase small subunit